MTGRKPVQRTVAEIATLALNNWRYIRDAVDSTPDDVNVSKGEGQMVAFGEILLFITGFDVAEHEDDVARAVQILGRTMRTE